MKLLLIFLVAGLLWSQLAHAQRVAPKGQLVVNQKLVSRFIKQTYLLQKAAIDQHFQKKTSPVEDWLAPAPGDKWVTYYHRGDTLVFYQSGRTATLFGCHLTNAARFARAVPFLASPKAALFAGQHQPRNTFTVTEAARNGQYTLQLRFQGSQLQCLVFDVDTSSY